MNKYKSRDLKGITRCTFRRSREIALESGKKSEMTYAKASLIKSVIKDALTSGFNKKKVEDRLDEGFELLGYDLEKTAKEHANEAKKQVLRYLNSEYRTPVIYPAKTVIPFNVMEVEVRPDLIFYGEKEYTYISVDEKGEQTVEKKLEPYIEVVKICCKLPDITSRGSKKDASAQNSLELYTYLMYCRELIESDEPVHIGASYYFLRKKNDTQTNFDKDFFNVNNAGNVVSLWEYHSDDSNEPDEMDKLFEPQFKEFENGEQVCDEKVCEKCEFYQTCYYKKPPKYIVKEKRATKLSDVSLTKEQEKAVYHRKGIARINAGAGAGKTLVSALRVAYMLDEGILPEDICMLTFTDTGAKEMTERVKLYLDDLECDADVSKLTSTTFNSFGDKIVRLNYEKFGFSAEPRLIDDIERYGIISKILGDYTISGLDYKNFDMDLPFVKGALYVAAEAFDIIKRERLSRGDEQKLKNLMNFIGCIQSEEAYPQLINAYSVYDEMLKEQNLIEYADRATCSATSLKR